MSLPKIQAQMHSEFRKREKAYFDQLDSMYDISGEYDYLVSQVANPFGLNSDDIYQVHPRSVGFRRMTECLRNHLLPLIVDIYMAFCLHFLDEMPNEEDCERVLNFCREKRFDQHDKNTHVYIYEFSGFIMEGKTKEANRFFEVNNGGDKKFSQVCVVEEPHMLWRIKSHHTGRTLFESPEWLDKIKYLWMFEALRQMDVALDHQSKMITIVLDRSSIDHDIFSFTGGSFYHIMSPEYNATNRSYLAR
jgi:hypothetical protein